MKPLEFDPKSDDFDDLKEDSTGNDTDDDSTENETGEIEPSGDVEGKEDREPRDDDAQPGFGVVGTLAGLGGVAYLLHRNNENRDDR